jgi:hypothetical protein
MNDGSERVLSVPMLLQIATSSNKDNNRDSLIEMISRNLLRLLSFRRFAILPDDSDRSQLFYKEKATSAAVLIAQMKNASYLKRNSHSIKK